MKRLSSYSVAPATKSRARVAQADRFADQLAREKAAEMENGQLANEIARCRRGVDVAANPTARAHFERRLGIFQAEADKRISRAANGGAL